MVTVGEVEVEARPRMDDRCGLYVDNPLLTEELCAKIEFTRG